MREVLPYLSHVRKVRLASSSAFPRAHSSYVAEPRVESRVGALRTRPV